MRSEAELRQAVATLELMLPVITPDNQRSMAAVLQAIRWACGDASVFGDALEQFAHIRRKAQDRN